MTVVECGGKIGADAAKAIIPREDETDGLGWVGCAYSVPRGTFCSYNNVRTLATECDPGSGFLRSSGCKSVITGLAKVVNQTQASSYYIVIITCHRLATTVNPRV